MKKNKLILFFILILFSFIVRGGNKKIDIKFNLKGHVFDYGQNIVSLELDTANLKIDEKSLTKDTFKVHAKGQPPINTGDNKAYGIFDLTGETKAFGIYDLEREIENIKINEKGNIVIELKYGQNVEGSNTLAYYSGDISRNVLLDLKYDVIQQKDFKLANGTVIRKNSKYTQNKIVDEEADRLVPRQSKNGVNYQFYSPKETSGKKPLIIWFHGNGEGGHKEYRNNVSQKLANRGAVAFVTEETQNIFGGAYVAAPQVDDTWYNNYSKGYINKIKEFIDEVVKENNVDTDRIYVFGASAGGYMSLRMAMEYPQFFAGVNVSAPALDIAPKRGGVETTAEEVKKLKNIPLWLVHAENDPTIDYNKTSKWVYEILKKEKSEVYLSAYPDVKIEDKEYNGHWSWIYSLRNIPSNEKGEKLFQWMAAQRLKKK